MPAAQGALIETSDGTPLYDPGTAGTPGFNASAGPVAAWSAMSAILQALNNLAVQMATQNALAALEPQLDADIKNYADSSNPTGKCIDATTVGCIVLCNYSQLYNPDDGTTSFSLLGVLDCSCGQDFQSALNATLAQPVAVQGPTDGGTPKFIFLWYKNGSIS
jgi:hypothetical protein